MVGSNCYFSLWIRLRMSALSVATTFTEIPRSAALVREKCIHFLCHLYLFKGWRKTSFGSWLATVARCGSFIFKAGGMQNVPDYLKPATICFLLYEQLKSKAGEFLRHVLCSKSRRASLLCTITKDCPICLTFEKHTKENSYVQNTSFCETRVFAHLLKARSLLAKVEGLQYPNTNT